jgi:hypothetical protein
MTDATQYAAMGLDQARAITEAAASKIYATDRWKALAAREYGLSDSTVYHWFRDANRPPFWFLSACQTRAELELLRKYLMQVLPKP